ncbi:MAG TPA: HlyD family secretion protein [Bacteroidales bacterium]|nr:HlyD family secretion protein [Bacteroidales bacterium]
MKNQLLIIILFAISVSCRNNNGEADAYGNFEAAEIIISAETSGRIIDFEPVEGTLVETGDLIALVDTTILHLQRSEIDAGIKSVRTRISSTNAQNEILNQQIENLNINIQRIGNMLRDEAATQKQYDDLTGQVAVLQKQIAANNTQKESVLAEMAVMESKKNTVSEHIRRSSVKSPIKGTIIEKYAEAGEITAAGKPLIKVADLSNIILKVYVSGAQMGNIKTGQKCNIRIDDGEKGYKEFEGIVRFIAEKAEFTPKIIQTKEERVTLVYAVEIGVANDGSLKSGMPGEVIF